LKTQKRHFRKKVSSEDRRASLQRGDREIREGLEPKSFGGREKGKEKNGKDVEIELPLRLPSRIERVPLGPLKYILTRKRTEKGVNRKGRKLPAEKKKKKDCKRCQTGKRKSSGTQREIKVLGEN